MFFAFTSVPAAKCCLTASIFPVIAALKIEMSGDLAVGGFGCCLVAHPTNNTVAIVVSRRCFIFYGLLAGPSKGRLNSRKQFHRLISSNSVFAFVFELNFNGIES